MDKSKDDPYLMDHNYDGIEELDNPMPTWWLITFFGTIIFGAIYFFHYEISEVSNSDSELAQDLAEIKALKQASLAKAPKVEAKDLNALIGDSQALAEGSKDYKANCAACHGQKGEGGIGPNLTDDFWIHGEGDIHGVVKIIINGVTEKGMVPWKDLLSTTNINVTAAYVISLRGTNPSNAKKPEGAEYKQ